MPMRTRLGKREVQCGGYVTYPVRGEIRSAEVRVWMPAGKDYADCGPNTAALVRAVKAQAEKQGRRNVMVSECWEY